MNYTGVKQSDLVILMKVTSRGRPNVLLNTVSEYVKKANNTIKMVWCFSFDDDDKTVSNLLISEIYKLVGRRVLIAKGNSKSKIEAINKDVDSVQEWMGAGDSNVWDILLNISDDQIPIVQGYDDIIRNTMPLDLDASLWFSDGWQPRINTQEIIGYNYYKRFGYIYNPIYKSFYCDNESTIVAKNLGKQIRSNKCIIKHFHPGWDKNSHIKMDDLYRHNDQFFGSDGLIFKQREANGFT